MTAIFIVLRVPNYLGFTPEKSLSLLRDHSHYLLLSGHIVLGSVAFICCGLQLWPWLRQRHPKVHRVSGRIYVIVVIPGSVLAAVSSVLAFTPIPARVGNVLGSALWLLTTLIGFRMARNRRFVEHRRWMIRSFALCFSIVLSRVLGIFWLLGLLPFLDSHYGGNMDALVADVATAGVWSSFMISILAAEWWFERKPKRRRAPAG
ncbi:MAG: DUF2306 domain-containing protein [Stackebrandtia sp.]